VSEGTTRWTIRLTDEDERLLEALCQRYGLKRPDAVRRAIREALITTHTPDSTLVSGAFIPLSSDCRMTFPVHLRRKAAHG
jgi:hypothetical protein